ncbi:NAD(P)H-dependent flavin oxidoreductase [Sporosarcina sp. CAU 1771]
MKLTTLLGIEHPIIQAPMAGVTTREFVVASAKSGIVGSIGAGYFSAEETRGFIRDVQKQTNRPFAVNLFVPEQVEMEQQTLRQAYEALQPIGEQLGMPFWKAPLSESEFAEQIQVVIDEKVIICSFTFGIPDEKTIRILKENDVFLIGTATTREEAILVEQAGMDAVVVQGSEAGGHRGSFSGELTMIPLIALLKETIEAVGIPVIAAGGIASKETKEKLFQLGAQAVQIGTAFLLANESGAHPLYKEAILHAKEGTTVLTRAFSGKFARGIRNRFTDEMATVPIAPYPYQNDLTKNIRQEAARQEKVEFMSMWAGENLHLSERGSLQEIVNRLL